MTAFGVSSNIGACSSHIYRNPVTIAAIERQKQKELERSRPIPLVMSEPVRKTAEHIIREGVYGTPFTVGDIKGPRRTRQLVEIRHQLIAKVYVECPWLTLPQIGKAFGGRDHTSCHFAVRKMGVHKPASETGYRGIHQHNTSQAA